MTRPRRHPKVPADVLGPPLPADQPDRPLDARLGDGAEAALLGALTFPNLNLEARRVNSALDHDRTARITVGWFVGKTFDLAGSFVLWFRPGRVAEYMSMQLAEEWQGRGVFTEAMRGMAAFEARYPLERWEAHMPPGDAHAMMLRAGWRSTGETDGQGLDVLVLPGGGAAGTDYYVRQHSNS